MCTRAHVHMYVYLIYFFFLRSPCCCSYPCLCLFNCFNKSWTGDVTSSALRCGGAILPVLFLSFRSTRFPVNRCFIAVAPPSRRRPFVEEGGRGRPGGGGGGALPGAVPGRRRRCMRDCIACIRVAILVVVVVAAVVLAVIRRWVVGLV